MVKDFDGWHSTLIKPQFKIKRGPLFSYTLTVSSHLSLLSDLDKSKKYVENILIKFQDYSDVGKFT